jgi:hypothetical protein
MLAVLDRNIKAWHLWAVNGLTVAWFIAITVASRMALPEVALFRCPVGFCAGGYAPDDLRATLTDIGEEGRDFLRDTLLPLDLILPALLCCAFMVTYVFFSRPGHASAIPLTSGARYGLLAVPLLYGLADYGENWAVAQMLQAFPKIGDALAHRASVLTAAKSQLVAASLGIAVALAIAAWGSGRSGRPRAPR